MPVLEWVSRVVLPSSEAGASGKIKGFEAERESIRGFIAASPSMGAVGGEGVNEVPS